VLGGVGPGQRLGRGFQKTFTTKTGVQMKYEFVPWTSYADRFLNELNSKGKLCDLIIGDSQWIGGAAENGHYVKLNDFFAKEKISMDDFMPATVVGYSQWPKNTSETIGHYRQWATRSAGPIARTGSPGRKFRPISRRNTSATSALLKPGMNSSRSPNSFKEERSTARRFTGLTFTPSAARKASRWA